jgi:hypothetical protein
MQSMLAKIVQDVLSSVNIHWRLDFLSHHCNIRGVVVVVDAAAAVGTAVAMLWMAVMNLNVPNWSSRLVLHLFLLMASFCLLNLAMLIPWNDGTVQLLLSLLLLLLLLMMMMVLLILTFACLTVMDLGFILNNGT